jgi:hypothetical protein
VNEDLLSELHLGRIAVFALASAALLFVYAEKRLRPRWLAMAAGRVGARSGPYRSTTLVSSRLRRAPLLVQVTSLLGLTFGHLFVPALIAALLIFPFDGIAVPLMPGIAIAVANWCSAWLLLGRSPLALAFTRAAALSSLVANIGLLALCPIHLLLIENHRVEGLVQVCSASVTGVELIFALASVAQAVLLLATLRLHGTLLDAPAVSAPPARAPAYERSL